MHSRLWCGTPAGQKFDGSWDGFVDLSREIMRGRNSLEQQETVAGVLAGLLPPQVPASFAFWMLGAARANPEGRCVCVQAQACSAGSLPAAALQQ